MGGTSHHNHRGTRCDVRDPSGSGGPGAELGNGTLELVMLMLVVGLGTIALSAMLAGYLLFGVRPEPVIDSGTTVSRFFPVPPFREVFGLWTGRRASDSVWTRVKAIVLLILMVAMLTAIMAGIAGGIGFAIGLLTKQTIG